MAQQDELTHQCYLGDGVYSGFDGYQIWVWADREGQRHAIALESPVIKALQTYELNLIRELKHAATQSQQREAPTTETPTPGKTDAR